MGGNQVVDHLSGDSADHHGLLMKSSSESREEAISQMHGILTAKQITRIGTWNVRTAFSTGNLTQIINEMKMQQLKILGISEMRWTGSGKFVSEDTTVIYYGGEKHERGVGILIDKTTEKAIINWEPVSDRIITARLKMSIIIRQDLPTLL